IVQGDLAEGRDASGQGIDRSQITAIGVPLDLPSSLSAARERRATVVARFEKGIDAELVKDLGRRALGRAAAVVPILVRHRTVAMIYGDDGASDVELSELGELIAMVGLAGKALERIARKKKTGSSHEADSTVFSEKTAPAVENAAREP